MAVISKTTVCFTPFSNLISKILRIIVFVSTVIFVCIMIIFWYNFSSEINSSNNAKALAQFGKMLFESTELSQNFAISCASCHDSGYAFSSKEKFPLTADGLRTVRRPSSLLGLNNNGPFMWDGRASSIAEQILLPLEGAEMRINWEASIAHLKVNEAMRNVWREAGFTDLSRASILRALSAYILEIDNGISRFDRYYYGGVEGALNEEEKIGFRIFVRKGRCSSCHLVDTRNKNFSDYSYHNIGLKIDFDNGDAGRSFVTGNSSDFGSFKTPSLRGVAHRSFFMHDGRFRSLRDVIDFYNRGGDTVDGKLVDRRITPLYLTRDEVLSLEAFLKTLSPQ